MVAPFCTDPIQDEKASVFWNDKGEIAHAHIGHCAAMLGRTLGWPYSEPLIVFVANLLANTKLSPKVLKEADAYQDVFGVVEDRKNLHHRQNSRE